MVTHESTPLPLSRNLVVFLAGLAAVPLPAPKPAVAEPTVVEAPPLPRPLIAAYRECLRSRSQLELSACLTLLDKAARAVR